MPKRAKQPWHDYYSRRSDEPGFQNSERIVRIRVRQYWKLKLDTSNTPRQKFYTASKHRTSGVNVIHIFTLKRPDSALIPGEPLKHECSPDALPIRSAL